MNTFLFALTLTAAIMLSVFLLLKTIFSGIRIAKTIKNKGEYKGSNLLLWFLVLFLTVLLWSLIYQYGLY